jgi:hypothetical protein
MQLSGGKGIGREGAVRLADLLHKTPPDGLEELDLRCNLAPPPLPPMIV